jgi:hypothetical protein
MKCVYSCEADGQRVTCSGLADSEGSFMRKLWEWVSLVRSRDAIAERGLTGCIVMCPLAKERVGSHIVGGVRQGFVVAGEELGATRVAK